MLRDMEQRPKTIPALVLAVVRSRWQRMSRGGRFLVLALVIAAGLAALGSARCLFRTSGCPYQEARSTPCHAE
jgi:hypothetical protein